MSLRSREDTPLHRALPPFRPRAAAWGFFFFMPPTIAYEPASKRLLTLYEASRITCSTVTAIGYVRRSKESGERTVSLEDQRARIAAYCAERGWLLAEILADDGVSGGNRERLERLAE